MKRLTTILLTFLFVFASFGQNIFTYGGKVLTYDSKVLHNSNENGNGYSAEFQAVYDSWTTKPEDADADELNTMVEKMVTDGVWAKFDWLHIYSVHTNGASEALVNWFNPGTFDATLVNAPAYVAFEGFTSNGTTSYINPNWNPFSDGINYVQNSASVGMYIRTNNVSVGADMGVTTVAVGVIFLSRYTGDIFYYKINDGTYGTAASTDSRGLWIVTRTGATARALYRNKGSLHSDAQASIGLENNLFFILCWSSSGNPSAFTTRQCSMAFAASGFTQTNVDDMTDAFEAWMDHKGKGVLSMWLILLLVSNVRKKELEYKIAA